MNVYYLPVVHVELEEDNIDPNYISEGDTITFKCLIQGSICYVGHYLDSFFFRFSIESKFELKKALNTVNKTEKTSVY